MIKKITEEFELQQRINVLTFLQQIKNIEYQVSGPYKNILLYNNQQENIKIFLHFSGQTIYKIYISQLDSYDNETILKIESGLNSKGVFTISKELYQKYLTDRKDS